MGENENGAIDPYLPTGDVCDLTSAVGLALTTNKGKQKKGNNLAKRFFFGRADTSVTRERGEASPVGGARFRGFLSTRACELLGKGWPSGRPLFVSSCVWFSLNNTPSRVWVGPGPSFSMSPLTLPNSKGDFDSIPSNEEGGRHRVVAFCHIQTRILFFRRNLVVCVHNVCVCPDIGPGVFVSSARVPQPVGSLRSETSLNISKDSRFLKQPVSFYQCVFTRITSVTSRAITSLKHGVR